MKITVEHLGMLEKAEVDVKPLTVFIGPNNAGKTWLAYTIASIFSLYSFNKYLHAYLDGDVEQVYSDFDTLVEQIVKTGSTSIDMVQFARKYGKTYFNQIAKFAPTWIPEFMSTQELSFTNLSISLYLEETCLLLEKQIKQYPITSVFGVGSDQTLLSLRKKRGESKLYIYTSQEGSAEDTPGDEVTSIQLPPSIIREIIIRRILRALHFSLYSHVSIFPTERTTFISLPFQRTEINELPPKAQEKIVNIDDKLQSERNIRVASGALSSFLSTISSIFNYKTEKNVIREKNAKRTPQIEEYIKLANLLEHNILQGNIILPQGNPEGNINYIHSNPAHELLFQVNEHTKIEMSLASSMVKELAPLALYLRYLAMPGELVVIDEPEMNLHPEAQVKMIEFLAMLVNAGLNIMITTHSPYVVDHLTNLIKASEHTDQEELRNQFYLKRKEAFISKDKVGVYFVEGKQVQNALGDDGVVELNTFGDVSDRLSEIYMQL